MINNNLETRKMHSNHLLLEEPIRMASILEPSKSVSIPSSSYYYYYYYYYYQLNESWHDL